jgi:putative flippase GtrA
MKFFDSKEFSRFLFAGCIAAAINFLSRIFFNFWFDFSTSISLAYIIAMLVAFYLKKHFVFPIGKQPIFNSIGFFILVNLIAFLQTFAISMVFLLYILPYFNIAKMTHEISHAVGILATVMTSYIGHKKFSFR